jgi:hypothetical protein
MKKHLGHDQIVQEVNTEVLVAAPVELSPQEKNLMYMRDKDREMVQGIVKNNESPGAEISFVYKKYKGDPIEKYTLKHNTVCRIPRGVARHINNSCWYPIHAFATDKDGHQTVKIGERNQRYEFNSTEFLDDDYISSRSISKLATVERVGLVI